uniref:Glutamate-rich protein 2 n=1 Tax=Scophthalmus maximus TaxID=52904 RepID=A0A8D3AM50_SCOMX
MKYITFPDPVSNLKHDFRAEEQAAPGEEEEEELEARDSRNTAFQIWLWFQFLRAAMDRDFWLARKLCQLILIYEPDNPEASEFLPLIQKKLLEEEEDDSDDDSNDDSDDDNDADSGNDEGSSSQSSGYSSSSCEELII